ncbi:hypothetical protein B0I32_106287 [Nonomuraea fuscirosea]|uniref:Uncharacterized protein n=1 Tax=Nonomuraea fuscirosea TaxID=1291556 RepID=A0A2T0N2H6_9ACTN|nr:hypothetical protein [Nonomuraea fuscirosea]PRX66151.1 hypothetical protein B0I32_106287 [Nonomuraea fuscirosea]
MRPLAVLVVWAALTAALSALAFAWAPVGYVLIPIGAIGVAFVVMVVVDGFAEELQRRRAVQRWQRQRAEFLAHRARFERTGDE